MQTIRIKRERKRLRLKDFDYSQSNSYFITICVDNHSDYFGSVSDGKMIINPSGQIAQNQFEWLQNQYPYIKIPVWIIMPDHVHAIIVINRNYVYIEPGDGRDRPRQQQIKIKPLPELIGAYKTTTSKKIHHLGFVDFKWQRSYHDRIVRNSIEYTRIFNYIENNPVNYISDKPESVN